MKRLYMQSKKLKAITVLHTRLEPLGGEIEDIKSKKPNIMNYLE